MDSAGSRQIRALEAGRRLIDALRLGRAFHTNTRVRLPRLLFVSLFAAACQAPGGSDPVDEMLQPPAEAPTYFGAVRPLLAERCGGCHLPGGIAPFAFDEYATTKGLASLIANAVETRRMPPWGAQDTDECQHPRAFKDDLRLSEEEIGLLSRWAEAGAPEGNRPAEVPPFAGKLSSLPRVDSELTPESSFSTAGIEDQFRCFVLDPGFNRRTFLQGVRFVPGNQKVVHHAIVYADPGSASLDLADAGGQYDCFGGPGFSDTFLVAAWAPGGIPFVFPERAAMPIDPGTKLVLQIHYHPVGAEPEEDLTKVELMHTDVAPEYLAGASFIGNFGETFNDDEGLLPGENDPAEGAAFVIPAGASNHTERMRLQIPFRPFGERFNGGYIHSVASHMHYVGRDMKIEVVRKSQEPSCSEAEIAPLRSCLQANCPDALGADAYSCVTDFCQPEAEQLSFFCGSCLQDQLIQGAGDALPGCVAPQSLPTELFGTIPDQPAEECLLQTPDWDFEWQRFYEYDVAIEEMPFVMPGDVFEFRCVYDNSMNNPFVREALREQGLDAPREVLLGDETLDEMCLVALTFLYKE